LKERWTPSRVTKSYNRTHEEGDIALKNGQGGYRGKKIPSKVSQKITVYDYRKRKTKIPEGTFVGAREEKVLGLRKGADIL